MKREVHDLDDIFAMGYCDHNSLQMGSEAMQSLSPRSSVMPERFATFPARIQIGVPTRQAECVSIPGGYQREPPETVRSCMVIPRASSEHR